MLAILGGGYYSNKICESMNKNCGKILVVPEKVLRNTKGAMRYVEEVLNYIMHWGYAFMFVYNLYMYI